MRNGWSNVRGDDRQGLDNGRGGRGDDEDGRRSKGEDEVHVESESGMSTESRGVVLVRRAGMHPTFLYSRIDRRIFLLTSIYVADAMAA